MSRTVWVDNAKAIGIYLIVLGHMPILPLKDLIYAFHVPLFLVVTGFLLPINLGEMTLDQLFRRYALLFLKAYLAFSALSICLQVGLHLAKGQPMDLISMIQGGLYGVSGAERLFGHMNAPLWYFPFLLASLFAAVLASRLPELAGWGILAIYAALGLSYDGPRLPWCLDIAGIGAVFIFAGHSLRTYWSSLAPLVESRAALIVLPILALLLIVATKVNGSANINQVRFGQSGLLFYLAAFAGVWTLFILSARLPATRLATSLSKHTLTIFALHIYLLRLVDPPFAGRIANAGFALVWSTVVLMACLALARVIDPWINQWILARPARQD